MEEKPVETVYELTQKLAHLSSVGLSSRKKLVARKSLSPPPLLTALQSSAKCATEPRVPVQAMPDAPGSRSLKLQRQLKKAADAMQKVQKASSAPGIG